MPFNNNKNANKEYISVNNDKHASKEYSPVKENLTQLYPNNLNTELTYSAFSMGTDLYNVDINKITNFEYAGKTWNDDKKVKEIAVRGMYSEAIANYNIINPAEYFSTLIQDYNLQYKKYNLMLNNHKDISQNPNKEIIIDAIKNSSILYIATHGNYRGLWIQNILLDENEYPYLKYFNGFGRIEFIPIENDPEKLLKLHFSDIKNIGDKLKWIVMAGCAQLNRIEDGNPTKGWANTLLRENKVHGVLGYYGSAPGYTQQNDTLKTFFAQLNLNVSIINAWKNANERIIPISNSNKNWAIIYNKKNKDDTIMEFTKDDIQKSSSKKIYYWRYGLDKPCEF